MNETEKLIRGIVDAAVGCVDPTNSAAEATSALLAAIDKAMSHAYAEGRADESESVSEWRDLVAEAVSCFKQANWNVAQQGTRWLIRAEQALGIPDDFEKAARLMNETGQGEHGGIK